MTKLISILGTLIFVFTASNLVFSQEADQYYFNKSVKGSFENVTTEVKAALKEQGFGIITEIEMDKTLKEKLDDVDMQRYTILGACNPKFAYKTLQVEENIGLFLPCKVLVKEVSTNESEVVMVNPSELMKMLGNDELIEVANEVTVRFKKALDSL